MKCMSKVNKEFPIHDDVFIHLQDALLFVDDQGEIIKGNDTAFSLLNIHDKNKDDLSIFCYMDFHLLVDSVENHLLMELKNMDGRLVEVKSIRITDSLYCLIMGDLSIKDKTEEVKTYINQLTQAGTEGIVMYNEKKVLDCNHNFANMFGYTKEAAMKMSLINFVDQCSGEHLDERTGESQVYTVVKRDGSTFHIEMIEQPYNNFGNIIRVAIVKDITERIENERQIEFMAFYDELTDLPNRNFL